MLNSKFTKAFSVFVFLFGTKLAMAAGILQLNGKIVAFSPNEVTIEVKKTRLYVIDRTTLSAMDTAKIKRAGDVVRLDVPMQSVKNVKEVKANRS